MAAQRRDQIALERQQHPLQKLETSQEQLLPETRSRRDLIARDQSLTVSLKLI